MHFQETTVRQDILSDFKYFYQMYIIIHGLIENQMYPMIYALLSDRKQVMYER